MSVLISMGDQFKGLPMADLIGGPLQAACDSQVKLAVATANFIRDVGFMPGPDGNGFGEPRMAKFQYTKMIQEPDGTVTPYLSELNVPILAIVKVPCLSISKVDITFDMEVKSSFSEKSGSSASASLEASASVGFGPFSASVKISGSVSTHKENTRTSDNSAKYHVAVLAEDSGIPEGLAKVLDILQAATEPILLDKDGKALDGNGKKLNAPPPGAVDQKGKPREVSDTPLETVQ